MGKKKRKQPSPPARQQPERKPSAKAKPTSLKVREFVESIVVAIIFVLVIKQFAAETFDIPTGSMEPTLLGAATGYDKFGGEQPARQGDHLIGDKLYYKYHPVDRYDIVLFKDPVPIMLDGRYEEHKTLIKRFVGLPGDTIEIRHGDLYVTNHELIEEIPEKAREAQDAQWRDVTNADFRNGGVPSKDWKLSSTATQVTASGTDNGLEIDLRKRGSATYSHEAPPDDTPTFPNRVTDLLIEVEVRPLESGGAVELSITEEGNIYTLHVPVGGGEPASLNLELKQAIRKGLEQKAGPKHAERGDVSLPVNKTTTISLTNADDRIIARLDGKEIFRAYAPVEPAYRDDTEFEAKLAQDTPGNAALTLTECHARLEHLRLARDVYYTDAFYGEVEQRDGRFFMRSPDPRNRKECNEVIVRLNTDEKEKHFAVAAKGPDGRFLLADGKALTDEMTRNGVWGIPPDLTYAVRTPYTLGADQYFAMGDNSPASSDSRFWGSVDKKYILGKAVFIFWPFQPFSDKFRPRLVH
jgi:signal peptidase I